MLKSRIAPQHRALLPIIALSGLRWRSASARLLSRCSPLAGQMNSSRTRSHLLKMEIRSMDYTRLARIPQDLELVLTEALHIVNNLSAIVLFTRLPSAHE